MSKSFTTDKEKALQKLQRYCAYQDRCHKEVRSKLLNLNIFGDDLEEIIVELIQDNFLNEERFARSFARGRFRMKKWGRNKIRQELKKKDISDYCIKKAMSEIEETDYQETLSNMLIKKNKSLKETNDFKRKAKLASFAIRKGFESELVWEMVRSIE